MRIGNVVRCNYLLFRHYESLVCVPKQPVYDSQTIICHIQLFVSAAKYKKIESDLIYVV